MCLRSAISRALRCPQESSASGELARAAGRSSERDEEFFSRVANCEANTRAFQRASSDARWPRATRCRRPATVRDCDRTCATLHPNGRGYSFYISRFSRCSANLRACLWAGRRQSGRFRTRRACRTRRRACRVREGRSVDSNQKLPDVRGKKSGDGVLQSGARKRNWEATDRKANRFAREHPQFVKASLREDPARLWKLPRSHLGGQTSYSPAAQSFGASYLIL